MREKLFQGFVVGRLLAATCLCAMRTFRVLMFLTFALFCLVVGDLVSVDRSID